MELDPFSSLPRGVAPEILIEQVRNTVPFFLEPSFEPSPGERFLRVLRAPCPARTLGHVEYFELCLAAHHGTVGSFIPTDVDGQIRFRLWHPALPVEVIRQLGELVIESGHWDPTRVSTRWVRTAEGQLLSGHAGEWLSTAAAAYGASRRRDPEFAAEIAGLILRELQHEAEIYQAFKRARDGLGLLRAATLIAHNLGDLDRVIDIWNLPSDDALREAVYKAGHSTKSALAHTLAEAGALNKTLMAVENHRHFALRSLKPLRRSRDLLLPVGPFFDAWGRTLAISPHLSSKEIGETASALIDGWERLKGPVGYARALTGILEAFPGGLNRLGDFLPAKDLRALKSGVLRSLCSVSRERFEEQWARAALREAGARSPH